MEAVLRCVAQLLTGSTGLGYHSRRKGWLAGWPREPGQLSWREQRWHQPVHWILGFPGKLFLLQ